MKHWKFITFSLVASLLILDVHAQQKPEDTEVWDPVPVVIKPVKNNSFPSDAIVLFDGKSLHEWESVNGGAAQWDINNGMFTVKSGSGDIRTKRNFNDFQLHIEWRSPSEVKGSGQGRGNSGVFLQDRYEVQVLDSYNNKTYSNGQAGSIYKQAVPMVNASLPPGEWQTYDIIYTAPKFDKDGKVTSKAIVTVLHNGVVIQNNYEIQGLSLYIGEPYYEAHGPAPIRLQDHGDKVSFRNVWIREI